MGRHVAKCSSRSFDVDVTATTLLSEARLAEQDDSDAPLYSLRVPLSAQALQERKSAIANRARSMQRIMGKDAKNTLRNVILRR